ncbi:MAG: class I SAM-dependent methyltransferase [Streptococcus sp.]|nr:class I SAM-dependent methyltransferase [Streptococcus sp.]
MERPLEFSHHFLTSILDKDAICVDATMGNGNDTIFLAERCQKVYAFDIQEQAIQNTKRRLKEKNIENVCLILDGHENVDTYVSKIRAAIFNLGYLPQADKSVVTKSQTTLLALEKIIDMLEHKGRVAIMVYYGHDGGNDEKEAILSFVSHLPQDNFTVMSYQALNQKNTPPFLIMIEKR